jgi:hypothetical protein
MISDLCFINRFLDTDDLDNIALGNNVINKLYLGCYPANVQPLGITANCCWIWNTDESGDSGTHWIVVWKDGDKFFFFDSYVKSTAFYKRKYWESFAKKIGCKFEVYSNIQRQSMVSKTCGLWALLSLYECCYNFTNSETTGLLITAATKNINDLIENEKKLKIITYKWFDNVSDVYRKKCKFTGNKQICCNFMMLLEKNRFKSNKKCTACMT